jgi:peptidoglycan/LPS O-acetylase OafA/YrhL
MSHRGPDPPLSHRPQLDGLRFLAFFAVFSTHAWPEKCPWGWAGVQFFFALSGFLITRILIRGESGRMGEDLRRFYVRRTLRIFPLYYALVLLIGPGVDRDDFGWYLTYTYNIRAFLETRINDVLGHFWTLCVEEQFYLLYPLLLLFTPARLRFALVVGLIAASKGFQVYAHHHLAMPWARLVLPYCGEDLLWGCVAGLVELRTRAGRSEGPACFLTGLPTLVLAWNFHERRLPIAAGWQDLASVSLFGIGSALVVFGAWRARDGWIVVPLASAPLAYLGRISYGLYAFHLPVLRGGWVDAIPYGFLVPKPYGELALTIALAALSWRCFEGPINRLKDRFARPAPNASGPPSAGPIDL